MRIRKCVLIVNGKPRAGKDTFAEILGGFIPVYKYSMVEKVKSIALDCGYEGKKDEKDRKFLADLKKLTDEYSNLSMNDVIDRISQFALDEIKELIFVVDVREPSDIRFLKQQTGAFTVFIDNKNVPEITSNEADANVNKYNYDFHVGNNGTKEEFQENIYEFLWALLALIKVPDDSENN